MALKDPTIRDGPKQALLYKALFDAAAGIELAPRRAEGLRTAGGWRSVRLAGPQSRSPRPSRPRAVDPERLGKRRHRSRPSRRQCKRRHLQARHWEEAPTTRAESLRAQERECNEEKGAAEKRGTATGSRARSGAKAERVQGRRDKDRRPRAALKLNPRPMSAAAASRQPFPASLPWGQKGPGAGKEVHGEGSMGSGGVAAKGSAVQSMPELLLGRGHGSMGRGHGGGCAAQVAHRCVPALGGTGPHHPLLMDTRRAPTPSTTALPAGPWPWCPSSSASLPRSAV